MATAIDLRGLVRPQLVEATKREDNPNVAEFRLQPLERGFGHTLGNAMRRLLLSSFAATVSSVRHARAADPLLSSNAQQDEDQKQNQRELHHRPVILQS